METLGGNELAYDSQHEEQLAGNIQEIIAEGGINPETGDPNIVAGPNVGNRRPAHYHPMSPLYPV